jgi:hypothetical protein
MEPCEQGETPAGIKVAGTGKLLKNEACGKSRNTED